MATYDDELLTYREAGQRLGVHPDSVMRRAKRQGWERVEGNAKTDPVRIRVPAAVLAEPWTSSDRAQRTPRISADAVATLGAALERQEVANKVLQATLDAARAEKALAQIDIVKADTLRLAAEKGADDLARRLEREEAERRTFQGLTDALRVELSAAEVHAAKLQAKLDALEMKLQATLDASRAEMALARIETGKADTLRLAAEKDADDLARRLESGEIERRALQAQTDAVRLELSAAEAHAADLQAQLAALETKLQADLDAARAEMALAQIETGKADTLRLAAEKGADDLARRLEREEAERRTLQDQTDAVRVELSAAEAHAADLQAQFAALETKLQADLDAARAEMALARIETGKADTLRLAAEKGADDLARRLEREEAERRTLQDQTDAVRLELSAAEAHAADLQAQFAALETKLQADLDAARAEMALARIETGKADTLRLAAEKSADDLARRLEREEAERRTLQDQTDAVRLELSAAEAHAADLQAQFAALETKLQADLDAARAEMDHGPDRDRQGRHAAPCCREGCRRSGQAAGTRGGQTAHASGPVRRRTARAVRRRGPRGRPAGPVRRAGDEASGRPRRGPCRDGPGPDRDRQGRHAAPCCRGDDLARRLEREEAERRTLQDQPPPYGWSCPPPRPTRPTCRPSSTRCSRSVRLSHRTAGRAFSGNSMRPTGSGNWSTSLRC